MVHFSKQVVAVDSVLTLQTEVFEVVDPLHGDHLADPEAVLQRAAVVVGEAALGKRFNSLN